MDIKPLTPTIGAEVLDLDLARSLDDPTFAALHEALLDHQVLVFRDQGAMQPADQVALAERFGRPVAHPAYPTVPGFDVVNILASTREAPTKIDSWHTDMTFQERPPLGSILRAIEIPPVGGDTMFSSLHRAYESLSERMQRYVDGLEAVHSFAHGFRHSLDEPGGRERLEAALAANPPRRHPVVRTHPLRPRKGLFVNRLFTTRIVGVDEAESDAILALLFDRLEQPEWSVRVRWAPGTVLMWDNRATAHRPVNDYWPHTRILHRVTIEGDRPR